MPITSTSDQIRLDVEDWTDAERTVLEAFQAGSICDFSTAGPSAERPTVRAEVLAQLILQPAALGASSPTRLRVQGADVRGVLDLGCGTLAPFLFTDCTFDDEPMLNDAKAEFVGFLHCKLPGLSAHRLTCTGPVWLEGTEFSKSVFLTDSRIVDLDARGISLKSSRGDFIVMQMSGIRVEHDVELSSCSIHGGVVAVGGRILGALVMTDCAFETTERTAFFGKLLRIGGNFVVSGVLKCPGAAGIDLEGSEIDGAVSLLELKIHSTQHYALNLDHAVVKLGVHAEDLEATGPISLHHATIACQFSLARSKVTVQDSDRFAIRADHAIIRGSMHLNGGFSTTGPINLHGAEIECTLNLFGIRVEIKRDKNIAILADAVKVGRDIIAAEADVRGSFWLDSAEIGGRVRIGGNWSKHRSGVSINLDRASMNGISADKNLKCSGAISVAEATVNGAVDLNDSAFGVADGKSLDLGGAHVIGDVSAQRSTLRGALDAPQAQISGDLRLADAQLLGTPAQDASRGAPVDQRRGGRWRGTSLRLRSATIQGDVDLRSTTISQTVDLSSSKIGHAVTLQNATLSTNEGVTLVASNATIAQLHLDFRDNPHGAIDLQNTQLEILVDDDKSWPAAGLINVEGLRYRQLDSKITSAKRLEWLTKATPQFSPQPYEQLAAMYSAKGQTDDERDVRLQAIRRSYAARGGLQRSWGLLQNATVGYGYRPFRALLWVGLLWLLGTLWFRFGAADCAVIGLPTTGLCPVNAASHSSWNPALLTLDLLSPFSGLGQDNAWVLSGGSVLVGILLTLSGWILVTTIAAALARNLKQ